MRNRAVFILTVLPLLLLSRPVPAETERKSPQGMLPMIGDLKAEVGAWVEYLHVSSQAGPITLRLAIVGRESDAYWHEISTVSGGLKNIAKLLVSGSPQNLQDIRRIIVKSGANPAIEMPGGTAGALTGLMLLGPMSGFGEDKIPSLKDFKDLGPEAISIKSGRVKARHYRLERAEGKYDVWISDKVPLWGLAKMEFPGGNLQLLGYGKGARTEITEKPQRLDIPFLLPPGESPRD